MKAIYVILVMLLLCDTFEVVEGKLGVKRLNSKGEKNYSKKYPFTSAYLFSLVFIMYNLVLLNLAMLFHGWNSVNEDDVPDDFDWSIFDEFEAWRNEVRYLNGNNPNVGPGPDMNGNNEDMPSQELGVPPGSNVNGLRRRRLVVEVMDDNDTDIRFSWMEWNTD